MPTEWGAEAGEGPGDKKRGKLRRLRQEGERRLGQCRLCSASQARVEIDWAEEGMEEKGCPKSRLRWAQSLGQVTLRL